MFDKRAGSDVTGGSSRDVDVKAILDAEKRADEIVLEAKKEADNILRHWNEEISNERMRLDSELNDYKTETVSKGMREVDKKVATYVSKKEKESDRMAGKIADTKFLRSLIPELFRI